MRPVMAMRKIGRGYAALEKPCGFLNLPEPPHSTTVSDIQKNMVDVYNNLASRLMISVANEIEGTRDENETCDITLSCDGTWEKKGYNFLNGIVPVILDDTGKCINYGIRIKNSKNVNLGRARKL